jgi:hypothetical protein
VLVEVELDALEEDACLVVDVLLGVQDVSADRQDEFGDRVDDPGAIRARQEQDSGCHRGSVSAWRSGARP